MALEDLKSNLSIGAGKPKSSPSGRHEKSPVNISSVDNLAGEGTGGLEQSKTPSVPRYTNAGLANSKKA
jgi:hypothetical protein